MTTSSLSAGVARPQVAASDVLDEMTESQASATKIGVAEFMSQLDSSHTQGLDELNFGNGDSYATEDEEAEEELTEVEEAEEEVTDVGATKEKGKKSNKRSANYSGEETLNCDMLG
jgi:hypothetical protein